MAEVVHTQEAGNGLKKRRIGHKKGGKAKQQKMFQGSREKKVKIDKRMQNLYGKRARDYNSDDDDDEEEEEPSPIARNGKEQSFGRNKVIDGKSSDEEEEEPQNDDMENEMSEDEDGEILPGVTKFLEGCNAFRMAFKKITKTNISDDMLGPVLSAHKKLLAEKLAEDETERKIKGEAKKEKQLIREKGHIKPANFLDSHEKFLIGVATKGVVKLFNAVNKAQNAQKGLNPSRSKDAKAIRKRRKEAFFSELGKPSSRTAAGTSRGTVDGEGPGWAPLRDGYMLTNSKLKDWDRMQDTVEDDGGRMSSDSSSGDD